MDENANDGIDAELYRINELDDIQYDVVGGQGLLVDEDDQCGHHNAD